MTTGPNDRKTHPRPPRRGRRRPPRRPADEIVSWVGVGTPATPVGGLQRLVT